MCAEKSVLSSLTPLIWISKLYGCLPFSFEELGCESVRVKTSLFGIIYGMALVILSAFYRIITNLFFGEKFSHRPIYISSAILGSVATLISHVSYTFYLKDTRIIYEESLEFSKLIAKNGFLKKVFWLVCCEVFLAEFMSIGYYIVYSFLFAHSFYPLQIVTEHYLRFVVTLLRLQFANSILLIFLLFNTINEKLGEMCKPKVMLADSRFKKFNVELNDLSSVMLLHGKACDSCGVLNSSFGPTLALGSICMMLQVVMSCYVLVTNQVTIIMFLFWFCSYVIEEWFVLYACEKVSSESARTGNLVHDLIVHTKDPRLKEQLQQFSLQLLHRRLEFSACGLFPLNYTLVYSIAGAVTTYLVIMLQMQIKNVPVDVRNGTLSHTSAPS